MANVIKDTSLDSDESGDEDEAGNSNSHDSDDDKPTDDDLESDADKKESQASKKNAILKKRNNKELEKAFQKTTPDNARKFLTEDGDKETRQYCIQAYEVVKNFAEDKYCNRQPRFVRRE